MTSVKFLGTFQIAAQRLVRGSVGSLGDAGAHATGKVLQRRQNVSGAGRGRRAQQHTSGQGLGVTVRVGAFALLFDLSILSPQPVPPLPLRPSQPSRFPPGCLPFSRRLSHTPFIMMGGCGVSLREFFSSPPQRDGACHPPASYSTFFPGSAPLIIVPFTFPPRSLGVLDVHLELRGPPASVSVSPAPH